METEEDRRAKLENDAPTKRLRLAMETEEEKKSKTGKDGSNHTDQAQVGPGDRGRKKSKEKQWI